MDDMTSPTARSRRAQNIPQLPLEVIERIIDASFKDSLTIQAFRLTCKALYERASFNLFRRTTIEIPFNHSPRALKDRDIFWRSSNLTRFVSTLRIYCPLRASHLRLKRHIGADDILPPLIPRESHELDVLLPRFTLNVSGDGEARNLRTLSLNALNIDFTDQTFALFQAALPKLKYLCFVDCNGTMWSFARFIAACTSLCSLQLFRACVTRSVTAVVLHNFGPADRLPFTSTLKQMELLTRQQMNNGNFITAGSPDLQRWLLSRPGNFSVLRKIDLHDFPPVDLARLDWAVHENLEWLRLTQWRYRNPPRDRTIVNIDPAFNLSRCRKLTNLVVFNSVPPSSDMLDTFLRLLQTVVHPSVRSITLRVHPFQQHEVLELEAWRSWARWRVLDTLLSDVPGPFENLTLMFWDVALAGMGAEVPGNLENEARALLEGWLPLTKARGVMSIKVFRPFTEG